MTSTAAAWAIEAILARLQVARPSRPPERRPERELVADDAGLDETAADRGRAGARLDDHELLFARVALERVVEASPDRGPRNDGSRRNNHDHHDAGGKQFSHQSVSR